MYVGQCGVVQYNVGQCNVVWCSVMWCSVKQGRVEYQGRKCSVMQVSAVCGVEWCSVLYGSLCSVVQGMVRQCSVLQCSAVQSFGMVGWARLKQGSVVQCMQDSAVQCNVGHGNIVVCLSPLSLSVFVSRSSLLSFYHSLHKLCYYNHRGVIQYVSGINQGSRPSQDTLYSPSFIGRCFTYREFRL